jgi:hypothetical protein
MSTTRGQGMSKQTRHLRCPRCQSGFFTENPTKVYCHEDCRKAAEASRRWVRKKAERG